MHDLPLFFDLGLRVTACDQNSRVTAFAMRRTDRI